MSFPYRCSKAACRKRVSLPRHVGEYVRVKTCPACGLDSLKFDANKRKNNRKNSCNCAAFPFPHRQGSSVFCDHSKELPTEEQYQQHFGRTA